MQRGIDWLDGLVNRRRGLVLGAWIVLLLASLPFSLRQTERLTSGGFDSPGSGSATVEAALADFPGVQRERLAVLVAVRRGADAGRVRAEIRRIDRVAARLPHLELSDRAEAAALRSAGSEPVTLVPLTVTGTVNEVSDVTVDLREALGVGEGPRTAVEPYLVGQQALWAGMQELAKEDLAAAEGVGFPIVLLILLAVFGSLAAAALPLALGVASVTVTGAAIFFLSRATDMSVFVTNMASMIGIGVAVDYSLFVLARYREEVRAGRAPDEARRVAMRTSGLAVVFSGVTVIIALAGLFLVNSTMMRSMAMGAIVVVAVSVLGAATLLPALIGALGRRGHERGRLVALLARALRRRPGRRGDGRGRGDGGGRPDGAGRPDFWRRWTGRVMRRPGVAALLAAAALLTLAIPALSLRYGEGALRQFPEGHETRVGAELAARMSGPGAAGPVRIVAQFHRGTAATRANRAAVGGVVAALRRDPAVAAVEPPQVSGDGRSSLLTVAAARDPESPQAQALVGRLRAPAGPAAPLARVARVEVGGATAFMVDFRELVSGSLWKMLLFVMGLSYVVLLVLLRSVVLPLKAVMMNLLSVGAAYGVLVAVFQYGWLDGLVGFGSLGYVNTMTPALLLAVVFGLSMDYEVFLLSRIRERYDATGDTRTAVAQGLGASARTITSAALIMVAVFAVFAGTGVPSIQEIGVGLAVAIALDATLVRLVLVPAMMELMGRWNWWLPAPLARILPRAAFESSGRADEAPVAA